MPGSKTDDRYQVVVHVDSDVLSQNVFQRPSGEPDCYIDKQVAVTVEAARRLSCSMVLYNLARANREQHGSHANN